MTEKGNSSGKGANAAAVTSRSKPWLAEYSAIVPKEMPPLEFSSIGDLLTDLDPSGETRKELGLLYIATVHNLERAVEDRDWQSFFTMLEEIDAQRAALRARVQALVESEKDKRSHWRQAGKEAG